MTWIRADTDLPLHPIVGTLAESLGISIPLALGHYMATLLGFGEHRADGRPEFVTDTTLEQWALWTGKRGKFAAVFREKCVEHRTEQRDAVGEIKGWWRQEALLRKQARDAERRKPAGNTPETRDLPPENPRGFSSGFRRNEDEDEDGNGSNQSAATGAGAIALQTEPLDAVQYAQLCTGACNRGLRENPEYQRGRGFNELVTGNQQEHTDVWRNAGIPAEFAAGVILERAKGYRPTRSYAQPTSLSYFNKAVTEAWDRRLAELRSQGLQAVSVSGPAAEPEEGEFVRAARQLERERALAGGSSR